MTNTSHTCEFVSGGHPDKFCDRVSDGVLDRLLDIAADLDLPATSCRAAIETLGKGNLVIVSGEISAPRVVLAEFDAEAVVQKAWHLAGYAHQGVPTVINYIKPQSAEIAQLVDGDGLATGAGDQGIMCGFAYRDGQDMMPPEYVAARQLIQRLDYLRQNGRLGYLRSDAKSQVSMDRDGQICSVIVSTQHCDDVSLDQLRSDIAEQVVAAVLGDLSPDIVKINYKGSFVLGGTAADCGVTGRKIVVDQYGPRAQVGGGAFSGKDPSKVDRSAAYMARLIARRALLGPFAHARSASVQLSYGIGQIQPASVMAILDTGEDISDWVQDTFPDLSPHHIQRRLGLWERAGWTYSDIAAMGHFGRPNLPWEMLT